MASRTSARRGIGGSALEKVKSSSLGAGLENEPFRAESDPEVDGLLLFDLKLLGLVALEVDVALLVVAVRLCKVCFSASPPVEPPLTVNGPGAIEFIR